MAEKYIIDGGFGASLADVKRGFTNADASADEDGSNKADSWMEEYEEEQAYRNTGFGRDTGNAR